MTLGTAATTKELPEGSYAIESADQLFSSILHVHCSRLFAEPGLARDALEGSISSFPNNTLFLSLYLWGEIGGRVYGRVQRLISQLSAGSIEGAGVIGHLWSVWAEAMSAHRTFWDQGGAGAERVRTALDKGIQSTR